MTWSNVCVEGFCFAKKVNENYPCGRNYPTPLCLENSHCPHFVWSGTTEREVATFVPLRLIVWDKLKLLKEESYRKLHSWFWGCLWFNRKRVDEFFDNIPVMECPELDAEEKKAQQDFLEWSVYPTDDIPSCMTFSTDSYTYTEHRCH